MVKRVRLMRGQAAPGAVRDPIGRRSRRRARRPDASGGRPLPE